MQQAEWQLRQESIDQDIDRMFRKYSGKFRDQADNLAKKRGNKDEQVKELREAADECENNTKHKKHYAYKILEDKKISNYDIAKQKQEVDKSQNEKESKIEQLTKEQRLEKYWSERLQEEVQGLGNKYEPPINACQEMAQMARNEAEREYAQRIIEYIQRMYQLEKEIIEKQLELIRQNQRAREKGPVSTDKISNLQVEAKAAMDKYNECADKLEAMINAHKKQEKEAQEKIDKTKNKKEDKKEEKKDNKTLDISGLQDSTNSQISAGALKNFNNLQEERPSSLRMS